MRRERGSRREKEKQQKEGTTFPLLLLSPTILSIETHRLLPHSTSKLEFVRMKKGGSCRYLIVGPLLVHVTPAHWKRAKFHSIWIVVREFTANENVDSVSILRLTSLFFLISSSLKRELVIIWPHLFSFTDADCTFFAFFVWSLINFLE